MPNTPTNDNTRYFLNKIDSLSHIGISGKGGAIERAYQNKMEALQAFSDAKTLTFEEPESTSIVSKLGLDPQSMGLRSKVLDSL